jgi:hypothetical protein
MSNLTAFVNGTMGGIPFNGTAPPVAGLSGTFGSPEILGIAGILIIIIIGWKMKVSPDLLIVSTLTMLAIVTNSAVGSALLPEWTYWLFILGGGVIFALGLIKIIKYR